MAECSIWARYLFPGLWTIADREGRLEDRPKRIKGDLLPYDGQEVEPLLQELAQHGFIERYQVDGRALIHIVNFTKHQNSHHKEVASDLPPPQSPGLLPHATTPNPEVSDSSNAASSNQNPGLLPQEAQFHDGKTVLIPSSLIPDSLNSDSLIPEGRAALPPKPTRGSRISTDWELPPAWSAWAIVERPDLDVRNTAAMFKDYWLAMAGANAVKADWEAAWRTWVRKEFTRSAPSKPINRADQRAQTTAGLTGATYAKHDSNIIDVGS